MKSISTALKNHLNSRVTTLATLFEVHRRDGNHYYFTDHDESIVYLGNNYVAKSGFTRTGITNKVDLAVDNLDVQCLFDSDLLQESEIRSGLFDYAEVKIRLVNYKDLTQGDLKLRSGWFGEVLLTEQGYFQAELRGLTQPLAQNLVKLYQKECRATLGDSLCQVPIIGPEIQRSQAVKEGQSFLPVINSPGHDYLGMVIGGSFNQFTSTGDKLIVPGWNIRAGVARISSNSGGVLPHDGNYYLEGGISPTFELDQIVSLRDWGIEVDRIDSGDLTVNFECYRTNTATLDSGRVLVQFLDKSGLPIGTLYDSGYEVLSVGTWVLRNASSVSLPQLTRTIKITLQGRTNSGNTCNSAFDSIRLSVDDTNGFNKFWSNRDGSVYQVSVGGTTSGSPVVYGGDSVVDGTATLVKKTSLVETARVTRVLSLTQFEIDLTMTEENWYKGGGVIFEDGPNRGRTHEVYKSEVSGNKVELFIPPPYPIAEDQRLVLWQGCIRSLEMCQDKFFNIYNFQGEPHIPGTDVLTNYPDAR